MKKISILCLSVLMALCAFAEKGGLVLYSPSELQVMSVSPNGKWACGIQGDGSNTMLQGVLWNLETGELTYLSSINPSEAYDVNDEGIVVGNFYSEDVQGNGIPAQVAGFYKDGKWTAVDNSAFAGQGVLRRGGSCNAISADGRTIVGHVQNGPQDYHLAPAKWVDGKLVELLDCQGTMGVARSITADGTVASGWAYSKGDMQRQTVIWKAGVDTAQYISEVASVWEVGYRFSPDGTKLACNQWGFPYVYDLTTGTKRDIAPVVEDFGTELSIWYVANDGLVLGAQKAPSYGYINDGEKAMDITKWLKEEYNVTVDPKKCGVSSGVDRSDDGKVIVLNGYGSDGMWNSAIVMLDQEITYCAPVGLQGEKMQGVNNVRLTWKAPMSNAENVLGYSVYRDGNAVAEGITDMAYVDADLALGTYTYTVTAIYEDAAGELVESEPSTAAVVEVTEDLPNSVVNIQTHAVNYNDLNIRWNAPKSNLPVATYFDPERLVSGFGGGVVSFSVAICLPYDLVNNYAGRYSIARVAFMPRNVEAIYTIKIFINDAEVASKLVDSANLRYNDMNNVDLDAPVAVAEGDRVLVAVEVDASNFSMPSNDVIGANYGFVTTGYSDLIKQAGEPEFYSLNQSAIDAGMGEFPHSFAISAIFAPVDENGNVDLACDEVVGYDIYRNNEKIAETQELQYLDGGLDETTYTYGIVAKYGNNAQSGAATAEVDFVPNVAALRGVEDMAVRAGENFLGVDWEAPLKNDTRVVSYATGACSGKGMTLSGATGLIEYTVAHEYPYSYLQWYEGYNIEALRFYPSDEALFVLALEEDGIDVAFLALGELGAEDGYKLNQWNNVKLEEPVKIKAGSTYRVKLICSEVDPATRPICTDNNLGAAMVSDLYSWDYSSYSSAYMDGSVLGNWMIGMLIANDSKETLPVNSYKVIIDGDTDNAESVTEPRYTKDGLTWNVGDTHRVKVNTVYNVVGGTLEVEGTQQVFNVAAGVESLEVDRVRVYPNPATSYIKVDGDAEKLVLVDMAGRTVAQTTETTLDVTALAVGNYLLNVYNDGNVKTVKVLIKR